MDKLTIYIHCDDNSALNSWTKKIYLLEANNRMELGIFKDVSECPDMQPEYVLNIQPSDSAIVRGTKWTGFWQIDVQMGNRPQFDNFLRQSLSPNCPIQTFFVASMSGVHHYPNELLLFQAADPVIHKRRLDVVQEYDFVGCGSFDARIDIDEYYERQRTYALLKEHFSYHDFGKNFPPQAYVKCISAAKVQWVQGMVSKDGKAMCAQRFFECLAIGPMLCQWNEDLALTGLVENEDYMCYRNDEELLGKMRTLLADEELRNRIATNGRRKALLYHTYEQRAMSIYNVVREFVS